MADNQKKNFSDFFKEWLYQPHYGTTDFDEIYEEPLYINDLIALIKAVETANPGLRVKLLWVANILSEPVYDVIRLVEYLENASLNNNYGVDVYGVEIGNECYFEIYDQLLGFGCFYDEDDDLYYSPFEHYWAYINGEEDYNNYFDVSGDFDLSGIMSLVGMTGTAPGESFQKHDYINALHAEGIKVGIPARNADFEDTPFQLTSDEATELDLIVSECNDWNTDLKDHYDDLVNATPAFDAVIPHQYFSPFIGNELIDNPNWGNIPLGIDNELTVGDYCLDNNNDDTEHNNFTTVYDYIDADERLLCAFEGIIGNPDYYNTGNFNAFIKTRHRNAFDALSGELSLGTEEPNPKEVWATEWNLKTTINKYGEEDNVPESIKTRLKVYSNTFVHCYLLHEQFLNMIKFNNINNIILRKDFLTISILHGYLGGDEEFLMRQANNEDRIALGFDAACSDNGFKEYVPRALYYSYALLNEIGLNNLNYVKSNKTIYASNINQPPTMFIAPEDPVETERYVYGYYSNIKPEPQTYIIRPGTLIPVSLTGTIAEVHYVIAEQLYSKSGKGALYDINDYYNSCYDPAPDNYFELNGNYAISDLTPCPTDIPSGAMCVTVPAYSVGYFVFSYDPSLRLGVETELFQVYPNPAHAFVIVEQTDISATDYSLMDITIYNMTGSCVLRSKVEESERIDIAHLPNGLYTITITAEGKMPESKSLVITR